MSDIAEILGVLGPYHKFTQTLECWVAKSSPIKHVCRRLDPDRPLIDGHHDRTRGAGGLDYGNELPLCQWMHHEIHQLGRKKFEERFRVSVTAGLAWTKAMWHAANDKVVWLPLADHRGTVHQAVGPFYTVCGLYGEMVKPVNAGRKVTCPACWREDRF